jgi:hypothetical protein
MLCKPIICQRINCSCLFDSTQCRPTSVRPLLLSPSNSCLSVKVSHLQFLSYFLFRLDVLYVWFVT